MTFNLLLILLLSASSISVSAHVVSEKTHKTLQKPQPFAKVTQRQSSRALVEISGRVITPEGQGIRNTMVFLIGKDGVRSTLSGSLGYFTITDIPVGESYALNVAHPRFIFAYPAEIIKLHTSITDMLVVGELNMFSAR